MNQPPESRAGRLSSSDKSALRTLIKARRDQAFDDPGHRLRASARITGQALTVLPEARGVHFVYLSLPEEVSTRPLIDLLLERGHTVLVPQLRNATDMWAVVFPGWDALVAGRLGILTPRGLEEHTGPVTAAFVPGLAFSATGERLGYGAGYYDRWLARHPEALRIALTYECQVVSALPTEAHDERMDYLITEQRCLEVQPARVRGQA